MRFTFVLCLSLIVMATGCSQDNEEELTVCNTDPASIRYASTITAILSANGCNGCHSGNGALGGGISLDNYASVKAVADNGRLAGAVSHASGYSPMPKGGAKISDCDIARIQAWIAAGAPNN
jgi:mono/diheme cytochrome c family protein